MKRFVIGAVLLVALVGGVLAWKARCEGLPRRIVTPCFDNRGRWYTRPCE